MPNFVRYLVVSKNTAVGGVVLNKQFGFLPALEKAYFYSRAIFWITNSKAFDLAGVSKDTPDPVGGKFDRDPVTGELTGGLHEKALNSIRAEEELPATRELAQKGSFQILEECASYGLTCVYDTVDNTHIRAVLDLRIRGIYPYGSEWMQILIISKI